MIDINWLRVNAPDDGSVQIIDWTSALAGIGLWGPNSRSDKKVNEVGTTIYRPPYAPLSFAAIAGRNSYEFYDPLLYLAQNIHL